MAVFNKRDLAPGAVPPVLFDRQVCISARTGEGKDALEQAVGALYGGLEPDMDAVITSARQAAALRRASAALGEAKEALCGGAQDARRHRAGRGHRRARRDRRPQRERGGRG